MEKKGDDFIWYSSHICCTSK